MMPRFTQATPPRGVFRGNNFITPEWESYWRATHNGRTVYAEVSTGQGINGNRIWGFTVRDASGQPVKELSKCCYTRREICEALGIPDAIRASDKEEPMRWPYRKAHE